MKNTLRVYVLHNKKYLLCEVLGDAFREGARVRDIIEKLSARYQLQDYIGDVDMSAILFNHDGIFLRIIVFDDILVGLELSQYFDLLLKMSQ